MDWIFVMALVGGIVWLASGVLRDGSAERADRCPRCGAEMELTPDSLDLMREWLTTNLPAPCTGCGGSGLIMLGVGGDEPWNG